MPTMTKVTAAAALIFAAATTGLAHADDKPGADWMPKKQVIEKLTAVGYTSVTGLEADDGRWEGKGVKDGKILEFYGDAKTGVVTKEAVDLD